MVYLGVKQMLYRKNYKPVLIVYSGRQTNASSQELSVSVNDLFWVSTYASSQKLSFSADGEFRV